MGLTSFCAIILSRRLLGGPLHRQLYCSLSMSVCLSIRRTCYCMLAKKLFMPYVTQLITQHWGQRSKFKGQGRVMNY